MTEADFWFLLGAASLSAVVIGWVCFLEVSYRLERRRRRGAASIGLPGLKMAGAALEILPQPLTSAHVSQGQLRITRKGANAEVKAVHASPQVAHLKAS